MGIFAQISRIYEPCEYATYVKVMIKYMVKRASYSQCPGQKM